MGQQSSRKALSLDEKKKGNRIFKVMKKYDDFAVHLIEANEWAKLCPQPRACHLEFRVLINADVPKEYLPYVWKYAKNVQIEVRKLRRVEDPISASISGQAREVHAGIAGEVIGVPKLMSVHQFYYVYCLLTDVRDCVAHFLSAPMAGKVNEEDSFDDMECQICMDKQKEIALPCTHSFCLACYKSWASKHNTCPICRTRIMCAEGEDLWELTSNAASDMESFVNDVVARMYEFFDRLKESTYSEEALVESHNAFLSTITLVKYRACKNTLHALAKLDVEPDDYLASRRSTTHPNVADEDYQYALSITTERDQFIAEQQFRK